MPVLVQNLFARFRVQRGILGIESRELSPLEIQASSRSRAGLLDSRDFTETKGVDLVGGHVSRRRAPHANA